MANQKDSRGWDLQIKLPASAYSSYSLRASSNGLRQRVLCILMASFTRLRSELLSWYRKDSTPAALSCIGIRWRMKRTVRERRDRSPEGKHRFLQD
jgi:hypothetical protein